MDLLRSGSAEKPHLDFCRHEKEVPARGMDLAIKREAIQRLYHAPIAGAGLSLDPKELFHLRRVVDQNCTHLNGWRHNSSLQDELCGQTRANVPTTNQNNDRSIRAAKPSSTMSLSRSGFIRSWLRISYLQFARLLCWNDFRTKCPPLEGLR